MRFNDDTRSQITVAMKLTRDPDGSTLELRLDGGAWLPCTWQDTAVEGTDDRGEPQWTQDALTVAFFAGPAADATGATPLALGRYATETRTAWPDGTEVVEASSPVDVKER